MYNKTSVLFNKGKGLLRLARSVVGAARVHYVDYTHLGNLIKNAIPYVSIIMAGRYQ